MTELQATKIGLRYDPPTLYLLYKSNVESRRRKMPLHAIQAAIQNNKPVDLTQIETNLKKRHEVYLKSLGTRQMQRLLDKCVQYHRLEKLQVQETLVVQPIPQQLAPNNLLSNLNSAALKEVVDHRAESPRVPEKETTKPVLASIHTAKKPLMPLAHVLQETMQPSTPVDTASITPETNLNKLDDKLLAEVKKAMEIEFKKSKISKDDPQFQYDLRKEFGPATEPNEWDSDDSFSAPKNSVSETDLTRPSEKEANLLADNVARHSVERKAALNLPPKEALPEKPTDKPTDKPIEKRVDTPVEKPVEKRVDTPVEKTEVKLAEKPIEKPVEKPLEKLAEKPLLGEIKPPKLLEKPSLLGSLPPVKPLEQKPSLLGALPPMKPAPVKVVDYEDEDFEDDIDAVLDSLGIDDNAPKRGEQLKKQDKPVAKEALKEDKPIVKETVKEDKPVVKETLKEKLASDQLLEKPSERETIKTETILQPAGGGSVLKKVEETKPVIPKTEEKKPLPLKSIGLLPLDPPKQQPAVEMDIEEDIEEEIIIEDSDSKLNSKKEDYSDDFGQGATDSEPNSDDEF
ncbi:CEP19-like protein-domain-containing protein [Gorgonomyces haynaldii]|nr:CEP19-like protein-domain-containing protein [Gorgonomyces haynaldii]